MLPIDPICVDWLPWCLGGPPTPESSVVAGIVFCFLIGTCIYAAIKL